MQNGRKKNLNEMHDEKNKNVTVRYQHLALIKAPTTPTNKANCIGRKEIQ